MRAAASFNTAISPFAKSAPSTASIHCFPQVPENESSLRIIAKNCLAGNGGEGGKTHYNPKITPITPIKKIRQKGYAKGRLRLFCFRLCFVRYCLLFSAFNRRNLRNLWMLTRSYALSEGEGDHSEETQPARLGYLSPRASLLRSLSSILARIRGWRL